MPHSVRLESGVTESRPTRTRANGSRPDSIARRMMLHKAMSRVVMAMIAALNLSCTACQPFNVPPGSAGVDQSQNATARLSTRTSFELLTPQEQQASQIAQQNGDREYLMVDKAQGKITLFENGSAIFSAAALTGESKADRLPPGTLSKEFSQLGVLNDKVTPAGRFTVSRDFSDEYGALLDINEIQGRDWTISIHQVYLGTPSERRADRLQSPHRGDKHITHGCINVTRETLHLLMDKLPERQPTVLYILPHDQSETSEFLAKRG
jgi:hypothetical protein